MAFKEGNAEWRKAWPEEPEAELLFTYVARQHQYEVELMLKAFPYREQEATPAPQLAQDIERMLEEARRRAERQERIRLFRDKLRNRFLPGALIFLAGLSLILLILLLSGCAKKETPLAEYQRAYMLLLEADSLALEFRDETIASEESLNSSGKISWRFKRGDVSRETGEVAVAQISAKSTAGPAYEVNSYFCEGWQYVQSLANPGDSYRCRREDGSAEKFVLEGLRELKPELLASESAADTAEGRLLTFTLDSAKFYELQAPHTAADYPYGEAIYYREPPPYTVLLDSGGRIIEVRGGFCLLEERGEAIFSWERSYTLNISQYGGVELEFPALNEADYPLLRL